MESEWHKNEEGAGLRSKHTHLEKAHGQCKSQNRPENRTVKHKTGKRGETTLQYVFNRWLIQVRQLQENASQLRAIYAGEKADAILAREQVVMQAWKELLVACEGSRVQVTTVTDKIQFFAVVRELSMWTDGIMGQIGPSEEAR